MTLCCSVEYEESFIMSECIWQQMHFFNKISKTTYASKLTVTCSELAGSFDTYKQFFQTIKNRYSTGTAHFESTNRIVMGHVQAVEYVAFIQVSVISFLICMNFVKTISQISTTAIPRVPHQTINITTCILHLKTTLCVSSIQRCVTGGFLIYGATMHITVYPIPPETKR